MLETKEKCCAAKLTSIKLDHPDFLPAPDGTGKFDLKAVALLQLPPRTAAAVDCGFVLDVPKGHRVDVSPTFDLASKGLSLQAFLVDADNSQQRLKLIASNSGKQIFSFKRAEVVGQMWFTPIAKVVWKVAE